MPPFKLEESYQKPEERIPSDIAEIRAHPEMVGFNVEEFRKKLEGDTIYTHPEGDPMREMEVLARQDKINFEVDIAEAEHKGFLEQARYDIEKYYRDLEKKPEVEFKKQLDQAVDKLVLKIENANNIANDLQRYPNLKFIDGRIECYLVWNGYNFVKTKLTRNLSTKFSLEEFGFPGELDTEKGIVSLNNQAGQMSVTSRYTLDCIQKKATRHFVENQFKEAEQENISAIDAKALCESKAHGLFAEMYYKIMEMKNSNN